MTSSARPIEKYSLMLIVSMQPAVMPDASFAWRSHVDKPPCLGLSYGVASSLLNDERIKLCTHPELTPIACVRSDL